MSLGDPVFDVSQRMIPVDEIEVWTRRDRRLLKRCPARHEISQAAMSSDSHAQARRALPLGIGVDQKNAATRDRKRGG
jgi:hypothetical protein